MVPVTLEDHRDVQPPPAVPPGPVTRPTRRRSYTVAAVTAAVVLVAAAGAVVGHELWSTARSVIEHRNPIVSPYPNSVAHGAPANSAELAASIGPALVDVNTALQYQAALGAGTGMVLTGDGEILTNNHVIEGAGSITVTDVGNGRTYSATVVGYSHAEDIAVLKLSDASGLKTVAMGDSSKLAVGDGVVAVGNAGGFGGTPTYSGGSITALGRTISARDEFDGTTQTLTGMIETNAQVVSGESGGALVDSRGDVVGMATAGSVGFELDVPYGYAIPINQALAIAHQIESGRSTTGVHVGATAFLGVRAGAPASGVAGALVGEVLPRGPAASAGLVSGDVITMLAGRPVDSPEMLVQVMQAQKPGTVVELRFRDLSGQERSATVRLAAGPPL